MPTFRTALAAILAFASACGARNVVVDPSERGDGGTPRDATMDEGGPPPVPPLSASCSASMSLTEPGHAVTLRATISPAAPIVAQRWTFLATPPSSSASLAPRTSDTATLVPDVAGAYRVAYDVEDALGRTAACSIEVEAFDGAFDPPELDCPSSSTAGDVFERTVIDIPALPGPPITRTEWTLTQQPAGSRTVLELVSSLRAALTPDRAGTYALRLRAYSAGGAAECLVTFVGNPIAPEATCPSIASSEPGESVEIVGSALDDSDVTFVWQVVGRPPGSRVGQPRSTGEPQVRVRPDLAGVYTLELTVIDRDLHQDRCTTRLEARNRDGLRIELIVPENDANATSHLLHPDALFFFDSDLDCFSSVCGAGLLGLVGLPWFTSSTVDNPRLGFLDSDHARSTVIERPAAGTYRVGVEIDDAPGTPTVHVFCIDDELVPGATFGPVLLDPTTPDFWRVVDVTIRPDGTCSIANLSVGGVPNVVPESEVRTQR